MSSIDKLLLAVRKPRFFMQIIAGKTIGKYMSDEAYVRLIYWIRTGRHLRLERPVTFTEKINWMKIYDRNPIYTEIVDKYRVKEYVSKKIGKDYVIPLIGVWESFDDIDFDKLPNQFVLKVNHDSGGVYICRDKSKADLEEVKGFIEKHLRHDFYTGGREWAYKDVPRRIICEEYIENLADSNYKFFCFNGKVKALYVAPYREATVDYYDRHFRHLNIYTDLHSGADIAPGRPDNFEEMLEIAEQLSKGFRFLRVDLYEVDGRIYFGELCIYHDAGLAPLKPERWERKFGSWFSIS